MTRALSAPQSGAANPLDAVKRRVLARVSLEQLIGERVKLTNRSGRPVGCCPFHAEKSPSFYIYDTRYFCFGCKASGDAIEFVRKMEGLSFVETLRYLAGKYGIEAPELDEARGRLGALRSDASLYRMMAEAQEFYVANLEGPAGEEARAYLLERGFSRENIQAFGFGLTPPEGYGLVRYLRGKGYKEQEMIDCSLATASTRDGRPYDFLRHRITIPIRDAQGRLIAFGGRALGDEKPKYKNSTNTKLFDKSHTLYGLDSARRVMREKGRAIVVEGYMDALQLWQQGFSEAVACLGTAFTEHHLRQLKHATGMVVLLFDGDGAGRKATLGSVSVALTVPEVTVKAASLPEGMDPDDFVRQHGAEALNERLHSAADLLDFVIRERLETTEALAIPELVSKEIVPWLARIPDQVQRDFLTHRIAHRTGVPLERLQAQLRGASAPQAIRPRGDVGPATPPRGAASPARARPLTQGVFDFFGHLYWSQPGEVEVARIRDCVRDELELDAELTALAEELIALLAAGVAPAAHPAAHWTSSLAPGAAPLLERLRAAESAFDCTDRMARIDKIMEHFRIVRVKATIATLKAQIARLASLPGHEAEVHQLLNSVKELSQELR